MKTDHLMTMTKDALFDKRITELKVKRIAIIVT